MEDATVAVEIICLGSCRSGSLANASMGFFSWATGWTRPSNQDTHGGTTTTRSGFHDGRTLGRWAEKIYWNILEAGFRIPPLAGTGDQCGKHLSDITDSMLQPTMSPPMLINHCTQADPKRSKHGGMELGWVRASPMVHCCVRNLPATFPDMSFGVLRRKTDPTARAQSLRERSR